MSIRWLLWSLLSPSQLILLSLLIGAMLLAMRRPRSARWFTLIGGAGLLLFGLLPTSIYLAHLLEARFPQPTLPADVTGIVLLSGAERPAASERFGEPQVGAHGGRFITALRLAARFPNARIVYSGGPRHEPGKGPLETQTAVAAAILGSVGLDPSRIMFEERSTDTCDNAANTYALVHPQAGETWVVVTTAIHMPRTMACFRAAGWTGIVAQPADYWAVPGAWNSGSFQIVENLSRFDAAVHEWAGLAYYRLAGRTREWFPAPI